MKFFDKQTPIKNRYDLLVFAYINVTCIGSDLKLHPTPLGYSIYIDGREVYEVGYSFKDILCRSVKIYEEFVYENLSEEFLIKFFERIQELQAEQKRLIEGHIKSMTEGIDLKTVMKLKKS